MILTKQAERTLQRMPANTAALIRLKIDQLAADPAQLGNNVKRLRGTSTYRLRVGDWRILYGDDGVVLAIEAIRPRGGAYE